MERALFEYVEEAGVSPTRGVLVAISRKLKERGVNTVIKYHPGRRMTIAHVDVEPTIISTILSTLNTIPLKQAPIKTEPPLPQPKLGMEQDVYILIQLFRGKLSDYLIEQLEALAPFLSKDGTLKPQSQVDKGILADNLKVSPQTISSYTFLMHNAYLWATEEGDFDEKFNKLQRGELELNAHLKKKGYEGVQALIDQKITDKGRYLHVKRDLLEAKKKQDSPFELQQEITALQRQIKVLNRREEEFKGRIASLSSELEKGRQHIIEMENKPQKVLIPPPPKTITLKTIANYLEHISKFGENSQQAQLDFLTAAEDLRHLLPTKNKEMEELPSHFPWHNKEWYKVAYGRLFIQDFQNTLNQYQKKAVVHMLLLLHSNPFHKSLNTSKPSVGGYYQPGTQASSFYSRASNNIRVFWEVNEEEKVVTFYRIIIKTG